MGIMRLRVMVKYSIQIRQLESSRTGNKKKGEIERELAADIDRIYTTQFANLLLQLIRHCTHI